MTARTRKHKHALTELEQVSCSWKRENLQWFTVYNTTCVYIGEASEMSTSVYGQSHIIRLPYPQVGGNAQEKLSRNRADCQHSSLNWKPHPQTRMSDSPFWFYGRSENELLKLFFTISLTLMTIAPRHRPLVSSQTTQSSTRLCNNETPVIA